MGLSKGADVGFLLEAGEGAFSRFYAAMFLQ